MTQCFYTVLTIRYENLLERAIIKESSQTLFITTRLLNTIYEMYKNTPKTFLTLS